MRSTLGIFGSSEIASDQLGNGGSELLASEHWAPELRLVLGKLKFIQLFSELQRFVR